MSTRKSRTVAIIVSMLVMMIALFIGIGTLHPVSVSAEEDEELFEASYNFEDGTGIASSLDGPFWDPATGWMGNSYVTANSGMVINGNYSYHIWVNDPGAWRHAGGVSIPYAGQYTVAFRYKILKGGSFGTVKFGGRSWDKSSNRGVGFGENGLNANHNIATDYALTTPVDGYDGVYELVTVVTTGDDDEYLFFSSMDGGTEYVIDDLMIREGKVHEQIVFPEITGSSYAAVESPTVYHFEDADELDAFTLADHCTVSTEENCIYGKSAKFDFTGTASDQVNFASLTLPLKARTYYQSHLLIRAAKTMDRWFHIVPVDGEGRTFADAYFNMGTGILDGFGFDRVSFQYIDHAGAFLFSVGFYTTAAGNYTIGLRLGVNDASDNNAIYIDELGIAEGVANYTAVVTSNDVGYEANKTAYRLGETVSVSVTPIENAAIAAKVNGKSIAITDNTFSFPAHTAHTVELIPTYSYSVTLPMVDNATVTAEAGYTTTVEQGNDFKFKVTLSEGYTNSALTVKANGTALTATEGVYTIPNITGDVAVTVEGVTKNTYTVTLPTVDNATVTVETGYTTTVEHGGDYKFKVTLSEGYTNSALTVKANGTALTATEGVYTVSNISGNIAVTVEGVTKNTYTVILPTVDNATVTVETGYTTTVEHGGDYKFKVTLSEGYTDSVLTVKANGTVLTATDGVYTVSNITGDVAVTVEGVTENVRKGGCASSVAFGVGGILALTAVLCVGAVVIMKKKENVK